MQTTLDVILSKKYLVASVVAVVVFNLATNLVSQEFASLAGNLAYVPIAGSFLVLALLATSRFGLGGTHGIAWFSFAGFAVSWFVAEMLWAHQELVLQADAFPSMADVFYLVGYPFLLMFFVSYLQPVRAGITRKIFAISCMISVGVLIPSLYLVLRNAENPGDLETMLGAVYPVFDSMVIIPAILGVVLFFKGQVNLMWTLICLGILLVFVADTAFLLGQIDESYYTGSPIEVLFYLNYVLLSFGVNSHLTLFKKDKKSDSIGLR